MVLTAFVIVVSACGDDGPADAPAREQGGDDVGGETVATVDGVGISIDEVEAMVSRTGLSPEQALRKLEEQELLAAEARRRGLGARRETREAGERAMIQRYLIERVEGVVTPASITDEAMRTRYEAQRDRYVRPALRRSTHLLFEVPEDASPEVVREKQREAARVLREAEHGDAATVLATEAEAGPGRRLEELPPFPRQGALEEPYARALFETPPGELYPAAVRTRYGFHVILVTEEIPGETTTFEEAMPEIRDALVVEGRAALLSRLLRELGAERPVQLEEPALQRIDRLELDP